ncbi:MAG: UDP-3-O-(3-hydroxymyristoyl)glucosamine N-acyltransferase, partial [Methylocystaceae bacterium]|nr:UDP-3-O-(3-hydroxymyristoyl)glucosamine N-acyltransferase [Methylocystaceae bacterium]
MLEIAELTSASLPSGQSTELVIVGVATLDRADASELSFLDNSAYRNALQSSRAGACFVSPAGE